MDTGHASAFLGLCKRSSFLWDHLFPCYLTPTHPLVHSSGIPSSGKPSLMSLTWEDYLVPLGSRPSPAHSGLLLPEDGL